MNKKQMLAVFGVLLLSIVALVFSANPPVQADKAETITPAASDWNFLPVVRGAVQGPTMTPTAQPTATAAPTDTPQPGRLASPTLFDILNGDADGSFTVGWSSVPGAEFFQLQQKRDGEEWQQIYEGSAQEIARSGLPDGQYCYRVMALNAAADSDWSATKCTTVSSFAPTPEPEQLPSPVVQNINNTNHDGNFLVSWSAVEGATNYRLQQKRNNNTWQQVYEGAETAFIRSRMADGQYCYRVLAFGANAQSDWSGTKCATVDRAIMTPEAGNLDPPVLSDIANDDQDGNFTVQWSAVPEADWYNLQRNYNGTGWGTVYEGFATSVDFRNMADGQYCHRVRSFNSETHSEHSQENCVTVGTTTKPSLNCSFEIVGRIQPGSYSHSMTLLEDKNIVVIAGGASFEETEGEDWEADFQYHDSIYVYDITEKRLHFAGLLISPRAGHTAIPLDDFRILMIGGSNWENDDLLNEIVHIETDPDDDGYKAYTAITEGMPFSSSPVLAETIDLERTLVAIESYVDYTFYTSLYIYYPVTNSAEFLLSFEGNTRGGSLKRMERKSSKFLVTTDEAGVIVDIKTEAVTTFTYPRVDPEGYNERRFYPELIPLDEDRVLLTNGYWFDWLPAETTSDAYIYDGAGSIRRIADTNYALFHRVVLKTVDDHVVLVSGYAWDASADDGTRGTEVFNPATESFYAIDEPHSAHAGGQAVRLPDGKSFLISGGSDDYFLDDEGRPWATSADLVELATCK